MAPGSPWRLTASAWTSHALRLRDNPLYRMEKKVCVLVGHHAVREYDPKKIIRLIATERYLERNRHIKPSLVLDERRFSGITRDPRPEGIMAEVPLPGDPDVKLNKWPQSSILLWRWQDPRNVGLMNRTALAMGVQLAINGGEGHTDPWGMEAIKCSRGATLHLPQTNLLPQGNDLIFLIADPREGEPLESLGLERGRPWCLVLGSEHHGLKDFPARGNSRKVTIPMESVESLNVATAGAILLYELSKKLRNIN